jgi:phospholipase D1/2
VNDTEFVLSRLNGKEYQAGKFCLSLRRHLFLEHLGLLPRQLSHNADPAIDTPPTNRDGNVKTTN